MTLITKIEKLDGKLPDMSYRWDAETEILSGQIKSKKSTGTGLTGSVELGDPAGAFVMLDVANGVVRGLEVVVWPDTSIVQTLQAPAPASQGQLTVPARASQPGIAAVQLDTNLSVEKRANESVIHIRVGPRRKVEVVQVAEGLMVEMDGNSNIAGLWLTGVPPFPKPES